ncbi:MAG: uncharacterized protein A8A55_2036 [Amphiamblys sp. WSBS2006]|nr:MAG: uncharacterized protein A8A55_2036 [Amphiamblys sp. WSBS2006]
MRDDDSCFVEEVELFNTFFGCEKKDPKQKRSEEGLDSIKEDRGVLKEILYRKFQKEYLERYEKIADHKKKLFFSSQRIFPLFVENAEQTVAVIEQNIRKSIDGFFEDIRMEESTEQEIVFAPREKKRKPRLNFTKRQREELSQLYQEKQYPMRREKIDLGRRIGLTYQQIEDWFSNRRTRELKKKTLEWFE